MEQCQVAEFATRRMTNTMDYSQNAPKLKTSFVLDNFVRAKFCIFVFSCDRFQFYVFIYYANSRFNLLSLNAKFD